MRIQTRPNEYGIKTAPSEIIAQSRAKSYSARIARKREIISKVRCAIICISIILFTVGIVAYGMATNPAYDFPFMKAKAEITPTENISYPDENYIYIICGVESNDNGKLLVHMPNGELHEYVIVDPPLGEIETVTLRATRENEEDYNMYTVVAVE